MELKLKIKIPDIWILISLFWQFYMASKDNIKNYSIDVKMMLHRHLLKSNLQKIHQTCKPIILLAFSENACKESYMVLWGIYS